VHSINSFCYAKIKIKEKISDFFRMIFGNKKENTEQGHVDVVLVWLEYRIFSVGVRMPQINNYVYFSLFVRMMHSSAYYK